MVVVLSILGAVSPLGSFVWILIHPISQTQVPPWPPPQPGSSPDSSSLDKVVPRQKVSFAVLAASMSAAVHHCLKLGRGWWPVAFTPPSELPAHLSGLCHLSLGRNVVCNLGGPSSRCPSAAAGEGPAAAGSGWWVREPHTPTCKCPSCLSVCVSVLSFAFLY